MRLFAAQIMPDESEPPVGPPSETADPAEKPPVKEEALFDDFANQASQTIVWSDAVKGQLPKKED